MAYAAGLAEGGYLLVEVVTTRVFLFMTFEMTGIQEDSEGGYGSVLR